MLLTNISPFELLSWCLYREGVVEMDIWSWIFVEKFRIIFKVCVHKDREEGVKNLWKCADILYGWPPTWLAKWYSVLFFCYYSFTRALIWKIVALQISKATIKIYHLEIISLSVIKQGNFPVPHYPNSTTKFIILEANNIEMNPGPTSLNNTSCSKCNEAVRSSTSKYNCLVCFSPTRQKCANLPAKLYKKGYQWRRSLCLCKELPFSTAKNTVISPDFLV